MKLVGTKKVQEEIEVAERDILSAAADILEREHGIIADSYIENGKIATYYARNNLTEYHGEPTADQEKIYAVLAVLRTANV